MTVTSNKLKATIKSKDGVRVFSLSIHTLTDYSKETLSKFFNKEYVSLEDLLMFCINQTEKNGQFAAKNYLLQEENKKILEESQKLQDEIENICTKLENI